MGGRLGLAATCSRCAMYHLPYSHSGPFSAMACVGFSRFGFLMPAAASALPIGSK